MSIMSQLKKYKRNNDKEKLLKAGIEKKRYYMQKHKDKDKKISHLK